MEGAASPFLIVQSDGSWSLASVGSPANLPRFVPAAISCPGPQSCVAAGTLGPATGPGAWPAVATTGDGGRSWTAAVVPGYGTGSLDTVTCPTPEECFAAGSIYSSGGRAEVLASTDAGQRWSAEPVAGPSGGVSSLACWDRSNCAGPGYLVSRGRLAGGALITTSDGGRHWSSRASPVSSGAGGLACPAVRRCVLVGSTGQTPAGYRPVVLYTRDGTTWRATDLTGLPVVRLGSVACASADFCVAVGQGRGSIGTPERGLLAGVVLDSTTTGADWTSRPLPDNVGELQVVACAASGFCVAGGAYLGTPMWRLRLRRPAG
jgi:photosystem II stability/assembly factor-like uncharacterized protein